MARAEVADLQARALQLEEEELRERAATSIQAAFRGSKTRDSVAIMRAEALQAELERVSAMRIQAVYRGSRARGEARALREQLRLAVAEGNGVAGGDSPGRAWFPEYDSRAEAGATDEGAEGGGGAPMVKVELHLGEGGDQPMRVAVVPAGSTATQETNGV